jgi:hypothetical protein
MLEVKENPEEMSLRNKIFTGTKNIRKVCKKEKLRKWDERLHTSIFYNMY